MLISQTPRSYRIDCLNWPDIYPYRPEVTLEIRHSCTELHLDYRVREDSVVAACAEDGGPVWKDSCVEFFFAPEDDGLYYNIECSCIGRLYFYCGRDRHTRESMPEEAYRGIRRRGSLGAAPFGLRTGPVEWDISLDIPVSSFIRHDIKDFRGLAARGNFYKCGDALPTRHYLSLFPIGTEKPDFHRPEFFDRIVFE